MGNYFSHQDRRCFRRLSGKSLAPPLHRPVMADLTFMPPQLCHLTLSWPHTHTLVWNNSFRLHTWWPGQHHWPFKVSSKPLYPLDPTSQVAALPQTLLRLWKDHTRRTPFLSSLSFRTDIAQAISGLVTSIWKVPTGHLLTQWTTNLSFTVTPLRPSWRSYSLGRPFAPKAILLTIIN